MMDFAEARRLEQEGSIAQDKWETVSVDFKGWRFLAPFRCVCCGVVISVQQFCFGRSYGPCDMGRCRHSKSRLFFSGPRMLADAKARCFIEPERWHNIDALPMPQFAPPQPPPLFGNYGVPDTKDDAGSDFRQPE